MKIYFDADPDSGLARFHHEAILGPRQLPTWKSEAERTAGKRPIMVDNPDCRIPEGAEPISEAQFDKLMAAQAEGKQIVIRSGKPKAIAPSVDGGDHIDARRQKRDRLLAASDWTQLPDSPLDDDIKAEWREYRTALRDLDLAGTDWPIVPDEEPS